MYVAIHAYTQTIFKGGHLFLPPFDSSQVLFVLLNPDNMSKNLYIWLNFQYIYLFRNIYCLGTGVHASELEKLLKMSFLLQRCISRLGAGSLPRCVFVLGPARSVTPTWKLANSCYPATTVPKKSYVTSNKYRKTGHHRNDNIPEDFILIYENGKERVLKLMAIMIPTTLAFCIYMAFATDAKMRKVDNVADERSEETGADNVRDEKSDEKDNVRNEILDEKDNVRNEISDEKDNVRNEISDEKDNVRNEISDEKDNVRNEISDETDNGNVIEERNNGVVQKVKGYWKDTIISRIKKPTGSKQSDLKYLMIGGIILFYINLMVLLQLYRMSIFRIYKHVSRYQYISVVPRSFFFRRQFTFLLEEVKTSQSKFAFFGNISINNKPYSISPEDFVLPSYCHELFDFEDSFRKNKFE